MGSHTAPRLTRRCIQCILISLLTLAAAAADPKPGPAAELGTAAAEAPVAAPDVPQLVKELAALRTEFQRANLAYEADRAKVEADTKRLQTTATKTLVALAKQIQATADARAEKTRTLSHNAQRLKRIETLASAAAKALDEMRPRIANGIPYQRSQRLDRLDHIKTELQADQAIRQARGLEQFFVFVARESKAMRSIVMTNEEVPAYDGRVVHAYVIRIGLVNQMFVAEDGRLYGLADRREKSGWRTALNLEELKAIREAFLIMQKRRVPELVAIPFPGDNTPGGDTE